MMRRIFWFKLFPTKMSLGLCANTTIARYSPDEIGPQSLIRHLNQGPWLTIPSELEATPPHGTRKPR